MGSPETMPIFSAKESCSARLRRRDLFRPKKAIPIYFFFHELKNPTADTVENAEDPVGSLRFW